MRKIQFTYPIVMFAIAGLSACSVNEEPVPVNPSGTGEIALSAQKMHIITRSGDEIERFDVGTKYWLYGIKDNQWTEGTEIDNYTINYGTVISFSDDPMNFYGVTYGTAEEIPEEDNLSPEPLTITEKVRENNELPELPDLMFSNNLQRQTANNGYRLEMVFKHAMSKLKFMIAKQDETGDAEKKLENVTLGKIVVKGTHSSGTLDIKSGSWSYSSEDKISDRTFVENLNQTITTTSVKVSDDEMLIFPNQEGEKVTISVTLSGLGSELNSKPIDYDLKEVDEEGNETGNFQFEMNHQYTLLITVLKDDVRVIAIAPQVYDWLDVVDKDNYLGQPVTFGNLMWMDRNIGAESADCYNEWEKCRGYYYQYARNLPYILDKDKYDNAENKVPVYPFLYTYNQDGEKVYGGLQVKSTKELENGTPIQVRGRNNIAVYPGDDKPIYEFIYDDGNGIWMYDETESKEDVFINSFWTSGAENHPCPKGWRLPTKEDFATFLPDLTISAPWTNGFSKRSYTGSILKYKEEIRYGTINNEKAMYVIKRQGRPDCYRIRLLMKESKEEGKWYFEIAQFPGDQKMTFEGLDTEEQFINSMNNGTFDWTTPSAVIEIPACGFIHPQGGNKLNGDGTNAILRSSDYNGSGTNWVFYLRDDDWQCGLINGSRKALGDQIRCVRDVTVNK